MKQAIKNIIGINPQSEQGFTLIEVLLAISVIVTTLVGLTTLLSLRISSLIPAKSKIIAVNLAQEGVEIVRTIRDNNWLLYREQITDPIDPHPELWLSGMAAGTYRVQYNGSGLLPASETSHLYKNSNGFYQYSTGTQTPFTRRIVIENVSADEIRVASEVSWSERGKSDTISVQTH